jgi:hypothetical protein
MLEAGRVYGESGRTYIRILIRPSKPLAHRVNNVPAVIRSGRDEVRDTT